MPKGHNEIKARHHAHEIRRRLERLKPARPAVRKKAVVKKPVVAAAAL